MVLRGGDAARTDALHAALVWLLLELDAVRDQLVRRRVHVVAIERNVTKATRLGLLGEQRATRVGARVAVPNLVVGILLGAVVMRQLERCDGRGASHRKSSHGDGV